MKPTELKLFEIEKSNNNSNSGLVIKEKLPIDNLQNHENIENDKIPTRIDVYDQINQFFGEPEQEQKIILETRKMLGEESRKLSDEQVFEFIVNSQFLVEKWLEEFEKSTFQGKTLQDLLNPKNEYAK